MTESLTDPRASQNFVVVSAEQMAAVRMLLFMLIRNSRPGLGIGQPPDNEYRRALSYEKEEMHRLLRVFEGLEPLTKAEAR